MVALVSGIVLATAAVVVALWWAGTAGLNGDKLVTARLDALRTGLSIGIGGGGALALYLSWRRQRAAEIALTQAATALSQKDRDHDHTEVDARERRITDLYIKAVEQVGSDKAPVRLGGFYALERLAQDNPTQRQTIVNVLCAYLRMPYSLPGDPPPDDADAALIELHHERLQELEVRLAAQRILAHHLRPGKDAERPRITFWSDVDLDLTNATLVDLGFYGIDVRSANFTKARLYGETYFDNARFNVSARFREVRFDSFAQFSGAWFKTAIFDRAEFINGAEFDGVEFVNNSSFLGVWFVGDDWPVSFRRAKFSGAVMFFGAHFAGNCSFEGVRFLRDVHIGREQFYGGVPRELEELLPWPDDTAEIELKGTGKHFDVQD